MKMKPMKKKKPMKKPYRISMKSYADGLSL